MEKVRDAHTIGLVVGESFSTFSNILSLESNSGTDMKTTISGTVAVAGHREAVQRVRTLARQQGKKVYVISVGKVSFISLSLFWSLSKD